MNDTGDATNALILVADDDPDIRGIVSLRLNRAGYQTIEASNGEDALRAVRERPPALLILDVMMPQRNGFEVAQELRGDPSTGDIPILMLTASVHDKDVAKGYEIGVDNYLRKPFKTNELLDLVASLLDGRP